MIISDSESVKLHLNKQWDYCIIGSGPAGIMLAVELAVKNKSASIVLIESGNIKFDAKLQYLSDLGNKPSNHAPMSEAVQRQVGGTSVIWGGRCVPYAAIDFFDRNYVAYSNWPINYSDLACYFEKACNYLRCGKAEFEIDKVFGDVKGITANWKDGDIIASLLERWSLPTNFGKEYFQDLKDSTQVYLFTEQTCISLKYCLNTKIVEKALLTDAHGGINEIYAQNFITAAGGLETTRLLMYSNNINAYEAGNLVAIWVGFIKDIFLGKLQIFNLIATLIQLFIILN